jgi:hypothetical protein
MELTYRRVARAARAARSGRFGMQAPLSLLPARCEREELSERSRQGAGVAD